MMIATTESSKKMKVWLHSFCPEALSLEDLSSYLQSTVIETEPYYPHHRSSLGIILVTEITPQICDFVRNARKDKSERILILLANGTSLQHGNPWQVLEAGASDVLIGDYCSDLASVITAKFQRWQEIDALVNSTLIRNSLVGHSRAWKSV